MSAVLFRGLDVQGGKVVSVGLPDPVYVVQFSSAQFVDEYPFSCQ